ncbi:DUF3833 domain-containing protein [Candidatus Electrothrix sp.]|uniref:DUF3833 domain-containing protein n=1 Tax=Candidatus Electrothrix sp. TaxID=2170559 RepID=UPI0040578BC0
MKILIVIAVIVLSGCSGIDVSTYQGNVPQFDLFTYFHGETKGWGMVQDRQGRMIRQFVVDIDGRIDPQGNLILTEDFDWSDGEKSSRVWIISRTEEGGIVGNADDVVGEAAGSSAGNVLQWNYHLLVEVDDRTWKVALDDWMFLQPDEVLINKTKMSKFGLSLGEITIVFTKPGSFEG